MSKQLGIRGTVLNWFRGNLINRTQAVLIDGIESDLIYPIFSVPQYAVFGLLFTVYLCTYGKNLHKFGVMFHHYADDIHIYLSFEMSECENAMEKMKALIDIWNLEDKLLKVDSAHD